EDGIRDFHVTGVQTCALPISAPGTPPRTACRRCSALPRWGSGAARAARGSAATAASSPSGTSACTWDGTGTSTSAPAPGASPAATGCAAMIRTCPSRARLEQAEIRHQRHHRDPGDAQRDEDLPAQPHDLVVAVARERSPEPDEAAGEEE